MDRRALEYFRAVADAGSVSGGATLMSVTQPAVSKQVARLESVLGLRLFHRTTAGMALTAAGETLYALSADVLTRMDRIDTTLRTRFTEQSAVRVVAPHTTATVLITPFMADTDPPISDLVIVPAPDVDVALDHDADLAISSLRPPLHRHQMVVADLVIRIQGTPEAMRARFGDRPVADLEALAGETVITPRTGVHGRVVQAAAGLDFPLSVRSAATGVVAQGLAANEHGFAAVTEQPDFGLTGLPLVVGGEPVVSPLHASWDVQHYAAPEVHRLARDFAHWMSVTPPWAPA